MLQFIYTRDVHILFILILSNIQNRLRERVYYILREIDHEHKQK